jgi:chorismate mutase
MNDLRTAAQLAVTMLKTGMPEYDARDVLEVLEAALKQTVQEPLSDEELDRLWREPMSADWEHREFARAIEAAHGIKEENHE